MSDRDIKTTPITEGEIDLENDGNFIIGGATTGAIADRVREEYFLSTLRYYRRSLERALLMSRIRKREHYEKPSVRRKKKAEAARKRKY